MLRRVYQCVRFAQVNGATDDDNLLRFPGDGRRAGPIRFAAQGSDCR